LIKAIDIWVKKPKIIHKKHIDAKYSNLIFKGQQSTPIVCQNGELLFLRKRK